MSPILNILFLYTVAGLVSADVYFLNTNWTGIAVGQTFSLYWAGEDLPVNISLFHGPSDNMQFVRNITVNNKDRSFKYVPQESNFAGRYALRINQGDFTFSSPRFSMDAIVAHLSENDGAVILSPEPSSPASLPGIGSGKNENGEYEAPKLVMEISRSRARRHDDDQAAAGPPEEQGDHTSPDTTASDDDKSPPLSYNPGGPIINVTKDSPLFSALKQQVAVELAKLAEPKQERAGEIKEERSKEDGEDPTTSSSSIAADDTAETAVPLLSSSDMALNQSQNLLGNASTSAAASSAATITTGPSLFLTLSLNSTGNIYGAGLPGLVGKSSSTSGTTTSTSSCRSSCSSSSQTSTKASAKPTDSIDSSAVRANGQMFSLWLCFSTVLLFAFSL